MCFLLSANCVVLDLLCSSVFAIITLTKLDTNYVIAIVPGVVSAVFDERIFAPYTLDARCLVVQLVSFFIHLVLKFNSNSSYREHIWVCAYLTSTDIASLILLYRARLNFFCRLLRLFCFVSLADFFLLSRSLFAGYDRQTDRPEHFSKILKMPLFWFSLYHFWPIEMIFMENRAVRSVLIFRIMVMWPKR